MRRVLPILALAAVATVASVASARAAQPVLLSAALRSGHMAVTFSVGAFKPGAIQVATRPQSNPAGGFLPANLVLSETIAAKPDPATGLVRWRTRKALLIRTYYVHVSALDHGGVRHWSNVRVVRAYGA